MEGKTLALWYQLTNKRTASQAPDIKNVNPKPKGAWNAGHTIWGENAWRDNETHIQTTSGCLIISLPLPISSGFQQESVSREVQEAPRINRITLARGLINCVSQRLGKQKIKTWYGTGRQTGEREKQHKGDPGVLCGALNQWFPTEGMTGIFWMHLPNFTRGHKLSWDHDIQEQGFRMSWAAWESCCRCAACSSKDSTSQMEHKDSVWETLDQLLARLKETVNPSGTAKKKSLLVLVLTDAIKGPSCPLRICLNWKPGSGISQALSLIPRVRTGYFDNTSSFPCCQGKRWVLIGKISWGSSTKRIISSLLQVTWV